MAHGDDGLDALVTQFDEGAAERHGLRAHRHAAEISVEIDAGEQLAAARAQCRPDLLPVVAVALFDRRGRRLNQYAIRLAELHRPFHRTGPRRVGIAFLGREGACSRYRRNAHAAWSPRVGKIASGPWPTVARPLAILPTLHVAFTSPTP
jgi:hypothetical protein